MAGKTRYEADEDDSVNSNNNPFSFAKFVRQRETGSRNDRQQTSRKQKHATLEDYSDDDFLPQDVPVGKRKHNNLKKNLLGDTLEDSFDVQSFLDDFKDGSSDQSNTDSLDKLIKNSKKKEKNARILKIVNDELQEIEDSHENHRPFKGHLSLSSDSDNDGKDGSDGSSCVSPLSAAYILPSGTSLTGSEANLLKSDLYQLEQDNLQLKQELEQLKEDMRDERLEAKKRIEDLLREVQLAKRKEAEETAALERVVQMVEENLEKTTRRAIKAENNVTRLKEDIKSLKENAVPRSLYDTIVEEYEHTLASVREKSQGAAESMRKAASEAEPSIRKIMDGLNSLRFIAEQFDDIDRITEISQHQSNTT